MNTYELINEMNRTPFQTDRFYLQAKLQGLAEQELGITQGMAAIIVDGPTFDAAVTHDEFLKGLGMEPKYEGEGQLRKLVQATIDGINFEENNTYAYRVRA